GPSRYASPSGPRCSSASPMRTRIEGSMPPGAIAPAIPHMPARIKRSGGGPASVDRGPDRLLQRPRGARIRVALQAARGVAGLEPPVNRVAERSEDGGRVVRRRDDPGRGLFDDAGGLVRPADRDYRPARGEILEE